MIAKPIQIATSAYGFNSNEWVGGESTIVLFVLLDNGQIFQQCEGSWTELKGPWAWVANAALSPAAESGKEG